MDFPRQKPNLNFYFFSLLLLNLFEMSFMLMTCCVKQKIVWQIGGISNTLSQFHVILELDKKLNTSEVIQKALEIEGNKS